MSSHLAKVQLVNVREGWPSEDGDFTPWLAANIGELGRALGLEFTGVRTEERLYGGARRVDIVAASEGRPVVIENQLEDTDNNHLSRLLIYAAGKDAKTVIWIAAGMDDEHWQVMHWLNRQNGNAQFYGVVVELLKVGDSKPAPYFKVVVAPGDMRERNTGNRQAITHRQILQNNNAFSKALAEQLQLDHNIKIPDIEQYGWFPILKYLEGKDLRYAAIWHDDSLALELVIEKGGDGGPEWNQWLFEQLQQQQPAIEFAINPGPDESLVWEPIRRPGATGRNAARSRIAVYRPGSVHHNHEAWGEYRSWFIEKYLRFHNAIKPYLAELGLQAE